MDSQTLNTALQIDIQTRRQIYSQIIFPSVSNNQNLYILQTGQIDVRQTNENRCTNRQTGRKRIRDTFPFVRNSLQICAQKSFIHCRLPELFYILSRTTARDSVKRDSNVVVERCDHYLCIKCVRENSRQGALKTVTPLPPPPPDFHVIVSSFRNKHIYLAIVTAVWLAVNVQLSCHHRGLPTR